VERTAVRHASTQIPPSLALSSFSLPPSSRPFPNPALEHLNDPPSALFQLVHPPRRAPHSLIQKKLIGPIPPFRHSPIIPSDPLFSRARSPHSPPLT
jgi:hypothetical protein